MSEKRPPLPPFTAEITAQKVQAAEDAWNTRDPEKVAGAYTWIPSDATETNSSAGATRSSQIASAPVPVGAGGLATSQRQSGERGRVHDAPVLAARIRDASSRVSLMGTRQLAAFLCGGGAAELLAGGGALGVTQLAASPQIRSLEKALGLQLADPLRTARRISR